MWPKDNLSFFLAADLQTCTILLLALCRVIIEGLTWYIIEENYVTSRKVKRSWRSEVPERRNRSWRGVPYKVAKRRKSKSRPCWWYTYSPIWQDTTKLFTYLDSVFQPVYIGIFHNMYHENFVFGDFSNDGSVVAGKVGKQHPCCGFYAEKLLRQKSLNISISIIIISTTSKQKLRFASMNLAEM